MFAFIGIVGISVLFGQALEQDRQIKTEVATVKKPDPLLPPQNPGKKVGVGEIGKTTANVEVLTTSPLLEITLETARPLTLGDARQGVYATLRNNSQRPFSFRSGQTVFVLSPAEGAGSSFNGGCADFPTLAKEDKQLVLQPSESYTVVWNLESAKCGEKDATVASSFDSDRIRGGLYKVIFNSQYEFENAAGKLEAHHITKVIEARFPAPFRSILLWSFLGGITAYWVKKFLEIPSNTSMIANIRDSDAAKSLTAILGSGLLSMVLVVLGTQAGDTAFPLKLDVSSLMGAFTSGFLLNFAGDRIIDWLGSLGRPQV